MTGSRDDAPTAAERRAVLRSATLIAGRVLPVHHPLRSFIAVNPLGGLEDRPFHEAIRRGGELYGAAGTLPEPTFRAAHAAGRITDGDLAAALRHQNGDVVDGPPLALGSGPVSRLRLLLTDLLHSPPAPGTARLYRTRSEWADPQVTRTVDAQTARWCAAFVDGTAGWTMPGREKGFYPAWRALAGHDRSLPRSVRDALRRLPPRPDDAALQALDRLGVGAEETTDYLTAHLTLMPGWAAHVRWHGEHAEVTAGGIDLIDYLAMRLTYESLLLPPVGDGCLATVEGAPPPYPHSARGRAEAIAAALGATGTDAQLDAAAEVLAAMPAAARPLLWLAAYEHHYREPLLGLLTDGPPARPGAAADRPPAQLVCCIDVRSEGLRRHLESRGPYETFGFAGFFAVAMRFRDLAGGAHRDLCPALVTPAVAVSEGPAPAAPGRADRRLAGLRVLADAENAFHTAKEGPASPFVLAEAAGWGAAPLAVAKTVLAGPTSALRRRLHGVIAPPAPTALDVNTGVDLDHRVLVAQVLVVTTGLFRRFARLVVLCAHGSSTENNPYQAALDCGACGGHRGGPTARAAAAILNDPAVRRRLLDRDIAIPEDTWFVAAEHDTTTDRVTVLDPGSVPDGHRADLDRLLADLTLAGVALAAERSPTLPAAPAGVGSSGRSAVRHLATRAGDWAQVYPEWGLAGNAAFIVGPRSLTAGLDLQRRAFLHSYDAAVDADGTALETILTAPLVVAQWINCQYYFSTVAPERFGAGTKTIHNVIGGTGVLTGHGGDLRLGLPWQSVAEGRRLVHEPMRLLAVVQAPLVRIDAIIDRNPVLQRLFGHEWVAVAARERPGHRWERYTTHGWQPWTPVPADPPSTEGRS